MNSGTVVSEVRQNLAEQSVAKAKALLNEAKGFLEQAQRADPNNQEAQIMLLKIGLLREGENFFPADAPRDEVQAASVSQPEAGSVDEPEHIEVQEPSSSVVEEVPAADLPPPVTNTAPPVFTRPARLEPVRQPVSAAFQMEADVPMPVFQRTARDEAVAAESSEPESFRDLLEHREAPLRFLRPGANDEPPLPPARPAPVHWPGEVSPEPSKKKGFLSTIGGVVVGVIKEGMSKE